ncbi:MAG: PAS domain-containing protein [Chloroflexi bacterium]|nr:PAS domain-containing protein [Chloroflexota bacterium]
MKAQIGRHMNRFNQPDLPPEVLDVVLQRAPVDVLLFDRSLICRYAAPAGESFLGQPSASLPGRPVDEILPPARNGLRETLDAAARDARAWSAPAYRFTCPIDGVDTPFCSAIQIEPVSADDYEGVLVILADARALAQLEDEHTKLHEEAIALRRALWQLRVRARDRLALISGYLQVIARRPRILAGRAPSEVIERTLLPQVGAIVSDIDSVVEAMETPATT